VIFQIYERITNYYSQNGKYLDANSPMKSTHGESTVVSGSTAAQGIAIDWSTQVLRTGSISSNSSRICAHLLSLDWTMLAAGIVATDNVTLSNMVQVVCNFASSGINNAPFGVAYDSKNGTLVNPRGVAR